MKHLKLLFPVISLVAILMVAFSVIAAGATSGAHYFNDTSASVTDSGAFSVSIDEAGVGQELVNYTLTWTSVANYGCINNGDNHPQASNKETTSSSGTDTFSESPINGRVHATELVPGTPPPAAGFSCPSGQTLVLADVSYDATLTDTTNTVSIDLAASRVFLTFK